MINYIKTPLEGLTLLQSDAVRDVRGAFTRCFCHKTHEEQTGDKFDIAQINHSQNNHKATVRGLHYQNLPHAEAKIVRCLKGKIYDVAVDLRQGSKTFLQWHGVELSAEANNALYIPKGFAHGFQTLMDESDILYLHNEYYTPKLEFGIRVDDPKLEIEWPYPFKKLSEKDKSYPFLDNAFKGLKV